MANTHKTNSKHGLIHCDNCGEEYSSTYRRCPFCDEDNDYEDDYEYEDESGEHPSSRPGGKRLARSVRRGGGYRKVSPVRVISLLVSLVVILAAAWVVIAKVIPLIQRGNITPVDPSVSQVAAAPSASQPSAVEDPPVSESPAADNSPAPSDETTDVSDAPAPSDTQADVSPEPDVSSSAAPAASGATEFSLSKSDVTFSSQYPDPVTLKATFTPSGSTGALTWSSSDPDVAAVDSSGKVSRGSKSGVATITATLPSGVSHSCTVRNQTGGSSGSGSSGSYAINNADFTLYTAGETYQLKVSGYTGSVTWSSSDASLVTVSADGTCTAVGVGVGKCTITGTLENGSTVTSIARIDIS
jgi:hypothetical protein